MRLNENSAPPDKMQWEQSILIGLPKMHNQNLVSDKPKQYRGHSLTKTET